MPTHAVVWIDQHEARIFHVDHRAAEETTVLASQAHVHRHQEGRREATEQPGAGERFFESVVPSLTGVDAILIVGPSSGKLHFFRYLREHEHRLEQKVIGVETVGHATDGEIVAMARSSFKANDRVA